MSDVLTDPAPSGGNEAPSVEADAPGSAAGEVDAGSARNEDMVPAARFNGLMGALNKEKARREALEAEINALHSQTQEKPEAVADTSQLEAQVSALTEMLMKERLDNARRAAIDEFPEAKHFADLIVADTPEGMREMARLISERARNAGFGTESTTATPEATTDTSTDTTTTATTTTAPAAEAGATTPEAPVVGGGSSFSGNAAIDERVTEAVKNRSFGDFMRAKWDALTESGELDGAQG